jgi:hypothetical protein
VWTSKAIQELLKQHEQDAAKATKPSKLPRLLYNFTEETTAVFEMVETLEFVTDPDMIALYVESEERRKKWFEEKGKEFVPDVPPDQLRLLDYTTCAKIHSWTDDLDRVSLDAAVASMFANDMGANAALMYDKMVKKLLSEAFSVQDELDLIGELVSVKLHIGDETTIRDDVTRYCTEVMTIAKKMDQSPTPEAQENWITQLNQSVSKQAASTGLFTTNNSMDKGFTLAKWCKALVQRATQVMSAENAFKEWHKGQLSSAERQELEMYRRQAKDGAKVAAAKTSAAVVKFTDNNAAAANSGFNGTCRRCKEKGHRAYKCPLNRPEPAPAKQAPAKTKTRQVANVVAEQESSAAGQGAGNVTLSDKQFQELLSRAAKNGK